VPSYFEAFESIFSKAFFSFASVRFLEYLFKLLRK